MLCGLGAAGIGIFLLIAAQALGRRTCSRARPLRIHDFVVIYEWWAAAINLALLVLLGLSARWWLRPARRPSVPWLPEQRTPRWFWPLVIVAMALTAFWGIQRIPQSLWDDEDSSLHRAVLGQYRRDKSGELKLQGDDLGNCALELLEASQSSTANRSFEGVPGNLASGRATRWPAIQRAGSPLSLPRRRSPVRWLLSLCYSSGLASQERV